MTAEPITLHSVDFYDWVVQQQQHEGNNQTYELWDGAIIVMSPSSGVPSFLGMRLGSRVERWADENKLGFVTGSDGAYILDDGTVFAPDVGFISFERMPQLPASGFIPAAPDLAVEVVSPSDNIKRVQAKARKYLASGTRRVWIVYPKSETVEVWQSANEGVLLREYGRGQHLPGEDVLPGFQLALDDLFGPKREETQEDA